MEKGVPRVADVHPDHGHADAAHVVPVSVLAAVFGALLLLTYITVAVTSLNLGSFSLWVALAVATIKGTLVVLYFMHLRYDSTINSIIFVTAFIFLFLFLGIVIMDSIAYQPAVFDVMAPGQ